VKTYRRGPNGVTPRLAIGEAAGVWLKKKALKASSVAGYRYRGGI